MRSCALYTHFLALLFTQLRSFLLQIVGVTTGVAPCVLHWKSWPNSTCSSQAGRSEDVSFLSILFDALRFTFDQFAVFCGKKPGGWIPVIGVGIIIDDVNAMWLKDFREGKRRAKLMERGSDENDPTHQFLFQDRQDVLSIFSCVK